MSNLKSVVKISLEKRGERVVMKNFPLTGSLNPALRMLLVNSEMVSMIHFSRN